MNETPQTKAAPRSGLFRRTAVERYNAPIETTTPWLLQPWRRAPLWLAALLLLSTICVWIF